MNCLLSGASNAAIAASTFINKIDEGETQQVVFIGLIFIQTFNAKLFRSVLKQYVWLFVECVKILEKKAREKDSEAKAIAVEKVF